MTISSQIKQAFTSKFRPENARREGYLGMSMIGGCPTAAYDSFYGTREADMRLLWYGFSGANCENGIRNLLRISDEFTLLPENHYRYHIEAAFDSRYRGHADIILINRYKQPIVVDVKSLAWPKFENVALYGKVPYSHDKSVDQVHAYMDHGMFHRGAIIYTPRDIPHGEWPSDLLRADSRPLPFHVIDVIANPIRQGNLNEHALWLLNCIDNKDRPDCTCGFCPDEVDIHDEDEIPF
jgi:hypothetical protein